MNRKIDTRAIGLDAGLAFIRWLTGAEHLHYGLWTGLDVNAANLLAAQEAYSDRLFGFLPEGRLRILDIGGGAGETAKRLLALGHSVEIVVPSPALAERCRANAPGAALHPCRFEDFSGAGPFDLCLFSESFQYIPPDFALARAKALLAPGGAVVIGDCFRAEDFVRDATRATVGGGHKIADFRAAVAAASLAIETEADVTAEVAPSVDLEQGLFNVFGLALSRIDGELAEKRPGLRWTLMRVLGLFLSRRRRLRLSERLFESHRNATAFTAANRYLMLRLRPLSPA